MLQFPIRCSNGHVFPDPTGIGGGGHTEISENSYGPCRTCGSPLLSVDGIFEVEDNKVKIVKSTLSKDVVVDAFKKINGDDIEIE